MSGLSEVESGGEHYLVSHGRSGGLGRFSAPPSSKLNRGDRVLIDSPRGREVGTVLCEAKAAPKGKR